ncbi:MAG: 3-ketosteroid 9alpha-monooxygenase subunit A [Myxococcota bacterium]|jgi:3-ketosteroid 9alpha-monooxygenase subunit A
MSDRFPFPIPNGWFAVGFSNELAPGDVKPVRYFARDLVLFRDADGAAHLLDAFCPHLGAHLGHGGVVEGNEIVCPFHAWRFDGSGACTRIPYSDKIPRQAKLDPIPLVERNGMLLAWHHLEGAEPDWEVPEFTECDSEDFSETVQLQWTVRTCNQEMAENAVDTAHFMYLHGTAEMPVTSAKIVSSHRLHATSTTKMSTKYGPVDGKIDVEMYGFGLNTTRFTGIVETFLISSSSPIDEDSCELRFSFMVKKFGDTDITKGIGRAFVKEISRQLEQDIPVWENKVYLRRPVLCDGDGPIGLFRVWAKNMYCDLPEESP